VELFVRGNTHDELSAAGGRNVSDANGGERGWRVVVGTMRGGEGFEGIVGDELDERGEARIHVRDEMGAV